MSNFIERWRSGGTDYLPISTELHAYRHPNWDPYSAVHDIPRLSLVINAEGTHLWHEREQSQMIGVGIWMSSARQIIGNALLTSAEQQHRHGRVPRDVHEIAKAQYLNAIEWRTAASEVNAYDDYRFPDQLDIEMAWPQPKDANLISKELFTGIKEATAQLLNVQHPILEAVTRNSFIEPFFNEYSELLARDEEMLQELIARAEQHGGAHHDPNTEPGASAYKAYVTALENVVALGAHKLAPALRDQRFRTVPRSKKLPQSHLPAFNPQQTLPTVDEEVKLAAFNPQPPAEELSAPLTETRLELPTFNPQQEETETRPELPVFNPSSLQRVDTHEAELPLFNPGVSDGESELPLFTPSPSQSQELPLFDPRQKRAHEDEEDEGGGSPLPVFDPRN